MMRRFEFRLQAVLEHRERLEQEATAAYAQSRKAVADAEGILDDMDGLRMEMMEVLSRLRAEDSIDPQEQLAYQNYITQVGTDIDRQRATIVQRRQEAEQLRLKLIDADREKKSVDKLREKSVEAFELESKRIEQNEVDEMATQRHSMRRSEAA